jgi:hypothetical protein
MRSAGDHDWIGPSAVFDQANDWIRSPISLSRVGRSSRSGFTGRERVRFMMGR